MIRTMTQRTAVFGLGVAATVLTAAGQAPAQQVLAANESARPASITASATRTSSAASNEHAATGALNVNVWSGNVSGDVTGRAAIMLERLGPPENALDPIWPVQMRWTVESLEGSRSFAAELFGTIDSRNHCMHLRGIISEGWKKGGEVQVDCLSRRKGGKVALRILPLRGAR